MIAITMELALGNSQSYGRRVAVHQWGGEDERRFEKKLYVGDAEPME